MSHCDKYGEYSVFCKFCDADVIEKAKITTDHAHLRALAEAATPGHWGFAIKEECTASTNHEPLAYWLNAPRNFYYDKSLFIRHNDARFIAEASPATIKDLLDTIERLTAENARLVRELAEEKAYSRKSASAVMALTADLQYIAGIAERGRGKPLAEDEKVTNAILQYVKGLEAKLAALAGQEPVAWLRQDGTAFGKNYLPTLGAQVLIASGKITPLYRAAGAKDCAAKYEELLYAVARKFPDESRHQTALRYIVQAENSDTTAGRLWPAKEQA